MGKETREKTRNPRNSPYNVSNSSFARRLTHKVAEYIAPTWVTGWMNPNNPESPTTSNANPNCTQVQVEINHVENSTKRPSIPNHNNVAANSNNKTSLFSKTLVLGNETCSPILNTDRPNRDFGIQLAGPSGIQLAGPSGISQPIKPAHNLFVSSTPAFNVNKPSAENGSDSGESTSGCSSLVSQSNKLRLGGMGDLGKCKSLFPNRQIPTDETNKSHNKSSGPQFDTSLFNSSSPSLNKSVNLSPFYPGRTMYGGASTYRKFSIGSNKSTTSPSIFQPNLRRASLCNQTKVNPSPTTLPKMSIVAENILKTINAMTPVTRTMSMPRPEEVNASPVSLRGQGSGVKRKLPELTIPTVVNSNLLQVKGIDRKNALSQSIQEVLSSSASSSDEELDYSLVSHNAKRSLKEKMKRQRRGRVEPEEVQVEVHLPPAVLNVPSLPVIDIDLSKPSIDVSFSDPVECKEFNISSETSLLSVSSSSSGTTNNVNTSVNFVYNSESNSSKPKPKVNVLATPVPVQVSPKPSLPSPSKQPVSTWDCVLCMTKGNLNGGPCRTCHKCKPQSVNHKIEPVEKPAPAPVTTTSLVDQFKPASDTWECKECFVRNKSDASTCVCCNTARPGAKVATPPVVSTSTASTTSGGFGDLFKKPSGNWECSVCMISNKSADEKCVACETPKPGASVKPPAANKLMAGPKFPFSTTSDAPAFKFGIDKVDAVAKPVEAVNKVEAVEPVKPAVTSSTAPSFSFGIPTTTTSAQSSASASLPAFSFGMPKVSSPSIEKKETSTLSATVPSTTSSTVVPSSTSTFFSSSEPLASPSLALFKPASTVSEVTSTSATPSFSFKSTLSSPTTATTAANSQPISSAPSFSFGTSNGPLVKPAESTQPVEVKPEVKELPKSLFGGGATSFLQDAKPVSSLFGTTPVVNSTENKLNTFDTSKVQFSATPTTNGGEPPAKMINFGKPAVVEPPKASIFGAAVFEKPKENNLFGNVVPTTAPPAFPSKPAESGLFSFGAAAKKPVANVFSAAPSPSAPVFNFGQTPAQPVAPQSNSFAAPTTTLAPAFNFNSTPTLNSNFTAATQTQPAPLFNPGTTLFAAPTPAATTAPPPMFGAPTSNTVSTPFSFGAAPAASGGFSFGGPQNSTPAATSGGFSFGPPATAAPPTFDPNMRPTFNFTAGTPAPSFNAQPALTAGSNLAARRYKKAVRRK